MCGAAPHALDVEDDRTLRTDQRLTVHLTAILLAFGADLKLRGHTGAARWMPRSSSTTTIPRTSCCESTSSGEPANARRGVCSCVESLLAWRVVGALRSRVGG